MKTEVYGRVMSVLRINTLNKFADSSRLLMMSSWGSDFALPSPRADFSFFR